VTWLRRCARRWTYDKEVDVAIRDHTRRQRLQHIPTKCIFNTSNYRSEIRMMAARVTDLNCYAGTL
jgi:hypothetical protein